jgi:hypothetical protein
MHKLAAGTLMLALATLVAVVCGACRDPAPFDPSSMQFGKKPCETNDDCASHFCGPDHRCG